MTRSEHEPMSRHNYFIKDANPNERYEYARGQIIPIVAASLNHQRLTSNTLSSITTQLGENRHCEIYEAEMRVQTKDNTYRYPDIVIIAGELEFANMYPVSLINPTLIIEVLAQELPDQQDRQKSNEYLAMPSVQEYVMISQAPPRIQQCVRRDEVNWVYRDFIGNNTEVKLESIDCDLLAIDVFRDSNQPLDMPVSPSIT